MTTKSSARALMGPWIDKSSSCKEAWGNNWGIDDVGCTLAKELIDRILSDDGI